MLTNRRLYIIVLLATLLLLPFAMKAQYHGKHVVIAVDQTHDVVGNQDMETMYRSLKSLLKGEEPWEGLNMSESYLSGDFKLNSGDRVSLLGFALPMSNYTDSGHTHYDAITLQGMSHNPSYSSEAMAENMFKSLIHPIYDGTVTDVDAFVDGELKKVCFGETEVSRAFNDNSGVTLSHYVFPKVLDYVKPYEASQEYDYIVVSNFKSGTTSQNTSDDVQRLYEIFGNNAKHVNAVLDMTKEKSEPLYTIDFFSLSKGNTSNNNLVAIGRKIGLTKQLGTSVYIKSNLNLEQESYGSNKFEINPIDISFVKDGTLSIDKIQLVISDEDGTVLYDAYPEGGEYDAEQREYHLPAWTFDSPVALSPGDDLKFKYIFYATPHTASGEAMMPFVYVADRSIKLTNDNFIIHTDTMYYLTIISVIAVILVICFVLWQAYRMRGKKALKGFKFNIWPISNTRYMNVKDNVVENFDCWYFRDGDIERRIQITGRVNVQYPRFAMEYRTVAEINVQDIDQNEDFTFRPDGLNPNGSQREAGPNKWYPINLDSEGHFDTAAIAFIDNNERVPNFARGDHNVLYLQVKIRVSLQDNKGRIVASLPEQTRKYKFIVRPDMPNSDLWMAFDPGTSGSCVAYGFGGNPTQTNNIRLAYNRETSGGQEVVSPIFYSQVKIRENGGFFKGKDVSELQLVDLDTNQGDYYFGNQAHILYGRNSFQSIKKLLGYQNELEVEDNDGNVRKIKGEDLAHLLVKGLCHEFYDFITNDRDVPDDVKKRLIGPDGSLTPSRAIVAVPNNYTVNKVQAMVDTVARTGLFKEVHYIYEAEGVMMYYLNLNWAKLPQMQNKTFVVFDMGGATINATAFRLHVTSDKAPNGSVYTRSIEVDTISRVGYTVGGDNIDFALIKIIYGMPSMQKALASSGMKEEDHRRRNKKNLISFVQHLKLDYIRRSNGENDANNWATSPQSFWTNLEAAAKNEWGLILPSAITEDDLKYFKEESESMTSLMKKLVIENVRDAVNELVNGMTAGDVELILSGRSVLYPGIREAVLYELKNNKMRVSEWNYDGSREKREVAVKTAVVRGACWYAMFSRFIALTHNKLTSTFGYIDIVDGNSKFVDVLPKNTEFDENGAVEREVKPIFPLINNIEFVQMLGRNYNDIYAKEIFHKMNQLAQVTQARIVGNVQSVKIRVDYNNNFEYEIRVAGESTPVTGKCKAADTDICDRNSEAYVFAALATLEDNKDTTTARTFHRSSTSHNVRPQAPKQETPYRPEAPNTKKRRF